MLKSIVLILTVAAACASATDNVVVPPPAKPYVGEELAVMNPLQEQYEMFCLNARDITHDYLSARDQQDFTTHIINILFQGGEDLGLERYIFQRDLMDQLESRIRDTDKTPAHLDVQSFGRVPAEDKYIYLALFGAIDRTKNQASRDALNRLEKYREVFGPSRLHARLTEACKEINELEFKLWQELDRYVNAKEIHHESGLYSVKCVTSRKVAHLNNLCRFAMAAPSSSGITYAPISTAY